MVHSQQTEEGGLLGAIDPARLPEHERLAFVGALSAMARVDGMPSMKETLAVLEELDLDGLSDEGVVVACEVVLDPPPLEASLLALRALPKSVLTEVVSRLLLVARIDGEVQPTEQRAVLQAGRVLALEDTQMQRAARRSERERWRRAHAMDRARGLDSWRSLLVAVAGFGAPLGFVCWLGWSRAADPAEALVLGLVALRQPPGLVPGIVAAMAVSVVAAALTSGITLRGWRVARLRREGHARAERVRGNLRVLVDHLTDRLARIRHAQGPRVSYKVLEGRLQALHGALVRLRSDGP